MGNRFIEEKTDCKKNNKEVTGINHINIKGYKSKATSLLSLMNTDKSNFY